ncbi:BMP and activin membrane-bound inhibitor (Xenopus laevis) homolog a [Erpetoichthys calabaricus]|uniref:BMP and activin membrane-bound inhibitor homolog n=1 Tax=Erpetoichthys calabaricus TaxID=27687 RepID=A0A8C4RYE9_ERPCA|nr:BMP and activin membrane-bound inhibitor (Xenopus laevis) homolog a [Erpetoichthys calabaricus]
MQLKIRDRNWNYGALVSEAAWTRIQCTQMDRHSSLISLWLQLELCAMAILLSKGEIRCYCDAPHCVATGYMCKSELNACFSKLLDPQNTNSPLTHGCLDSIASTTSEMCRAKVTENHAGLSAKLECCHDDMCNYRGLHDVLSHARGDVSDHSTRYQPDSSRNLITRVQDLTSSKELWFRAAVIAVPIAGGLILVLLIMLALRMLRSENKRLQDQRQQMLSRLHYSFHGHHTKKGQVAKLDLECMVPVTGHENCCLTCDKMRQADLGNDKILSLVHWGMYSGHGKLEFV